MDKRRIEAESFRDAILQISGKISVTQPTGSQLAEKGQTTIGRANQLNIDIGAPYRSVYLPVVRDFDLNARFRQNIDRHFLIDQIVFSQ